MAGAPASFAVLTGLALLAAATAGAATKISVSVVEPKSGKFVPGLKASDFIVMDDKTPRQVEEVEAASSPLDVLLLLDTSLVGGAVQPVAASLIAELGDKDSMAVVSVHSSADLIQEFTSSKELLSRAVHGAKYGNTPRLLDGLYAAIEGGFEDTIYRRVALLLTTGFEGSSRVNEKDVVRLAQKNGVSIYPIYMAGAERSMFENLARRTGGASFSLQQLKRAESGAPGPRIFDTVRQFYTLTLSGNLSLSDKLRVEVRSRQKVFVSALTQE
jgi:VWFA-related protein